MYLCDYYLIPQKIQREIIKEYSEYALLGPRDVPLPPPFRPPFKILGKLIDAFLYNEEVYKFISINRNRVRKYSKKIYG